MLTSSAGSMVGLPIGLPLLVPVSLARRRPARTRSRIIARSNSANTPIIPNMALPDGVVVSSPLLVQIQVDFQRVDFRQQIDEILQRPA
jgi:hypothetical protein